MQALIIEDDSGVASFVERGLSDNGFRTTVATDGREGFDRAFQGNFDIIVLDLMLPGRDGFNILQDLRAAGLERPSFVLQHGTAWTIAFAAWT